MEYSGGPRRHTPPGSVAVVRFFAYVAYAAMSMSSLLAGAYSSPKNSARTSSQLSTASSSAPVRVVRAGMVMSA